ncbi:hypothetical protein I4U23_016148 [Adineta vaga]|nr:hypothetical protein I4U23_016148 [Adineta vaga]
MDDMLSEFDGHIGDCGCQLRAQMLWSITEHYRESKSREWIGNVVQTLQHIKNKIIAMYCDIRRVKSDNQFLGFPSSIPLIDILTVLSANLCEKSSGIRLNKRERRRTAKADKWNLSDYRMVARFLSYCRILSLNKKAVLEPGATRIRSRLDPLFAAAVTKKQLDDLNLIHDGPLSNFLTRDDQPTRTGLVREIENMQVYVSQLTCDWLTKLSLEMGLAQPIQK